MAIEYAWRSQDRYDAALFVVAESRDVLHSGLASLTRIGLQDLSPSPSGAQEEDSINVMQWLREHSRWLLILDNVDDKEALLAVTEILPFLANGHVLITSRLRDWPAGIRKQYLERLAREEAQRFLLQRTESGQSPTSSDTEQALYLAEELQGLPLALEQAAAFIFHHGLTSPSICSPGKKSARRF